MAIEQPAQAVSVNLKGILLAVIVVCAALIVFSKLWSRRAAAEIPRINPRATSSTYAADYR